MSNKGKSSDSDQRQRRRFLRQIGFFSVCAATVGLPLLNKKRQLRKQEAPAKMLTEDGRLVEVDASFLKASTKKVTNAELKQWIKKNKN